jgi:hypothetical protein
VQYGTRHQSIWTGGRLVYACSATVMPSEGQVPLAVLNQFQASSAINMSTFCLAYVVYPTFVDAAAKDIHVLDTVSHDITSLQNSSSTISTSSIHHSMLADVGNHWMGSANPPFSKKSDLRGWHHSLSSLKASHSSLDILPHAPTCHIRTSVILPSPSLCIYKISFIHRSCHFISGNSACKYSADHPHLQWLPKLIQCFALFHCLCKGSWHYLQFICP